MIFHHIAIYTQCLEEEVDFYQKYFGFIIIKRLFTGPVAMGYHLRQFNSNFVLEILKGKESIKNSSFHLAFFVSEVEEFYKNNKNKLNFIKPPFCVGQETIAFLSDPTGYQIEINNQLQCYTC